jgi:ubiquinone/menaquinone biosynthesis C-methylase UbiE
MDDRLSLSRQSLDRISRLGYLAVIEPFLAGAKRKVCRIVDELGAVSLLEVGCGTCTQAVALARRGVRVTAVDISGRLFPPPSRRLPPGLRHFRADGRSLPLPDGGFDVAFASMALHEMPPENRLPVLAEMRRLVRPGGAILIMDYHLEPVRAPGMAEWIIRVMEWAAGREHNGHFHDYVDRGGVPSLARAAGLEIAQRHPILAGRGGIFELTVHR